MWFKPKPKIEFAVKSSNPVLCQQLLDKIQKQQTEDDAAPIVSLDDFFLGNEDYGSIGCNLNCAISPQAFYETLKSIRSRSDVQEIWIEITDSNQEDSDSLMWPFSDQIYLVTSASRQEVADWTAFLQPDEVDTNHINRRLGWVTNESDMKIYRVWWD